MLFDIIIFPIYECYFSGECNATCEHSTLNEDTCVCICFGSWTGDKCGMSVKTKT